MIIDQAEPMPRGYRRSTRVLNQRVWRREAGASAHTELPLGVELADPNDYDREPHWRPIDLGPDTFEPPLSQLAPWPDDLTVLGDVPPSGGFGGDRRGFVDVGAIGEIFGVYGQIFFDDGVPPGASLPRPAFVRCNVVGQQEDQILVVSTVPDHVEAEDGTTQFRVRPNQLERRA
ncbi:hypothetical protein [Micromonospora sp. SL4-19]|uniref:hypothetical protein n=1 Tax=Micromonospora sp. SL4-19 TaxID=3399129 RepID=UPI003A4E05C7